MPAETRSLSGKTIAITGATSGIGRAAARLLVEEGARVALTGRRGDRLADLVAEFGADTAIALAGDIRQPDASRNLVAAAVARWGRLDAIVATGVHTEFAIGAGRTEGDPELDSYLRPEDVAFQIVTALRQPARLRTTLWAEWPMAQAT